MRCDLSTQWLCASISTSVEISRETHLDLLDGGVELGYGPGDDGDVGAPCGEEVRDAQTEPLRAAGDDDVLRARQLGP